MTNLETSGQRTLTVEQTAPVQAPRAPKWRDVEEQLLMLCRAGQPYSGDRALAKRLHVGRWLVQYAFAKSDELKTWRTKARLPCGSRPKWPDVQNRLLKLCRAGEPYSGDRVLAKRLHTSQGSVRRAFAHSDELKAWRDKAGLRGGPRPTWPDVQARLLKVCRAGEAYCGLRRLANRLYTTRGLVRLAISKSDELKTWRNKARLLGGHWRPLWSNIQKRLLTLYRAREPYSNLTLLARRLRTKRWIVDRAIQKSDELKSWQDRANPRGGRSPDVQERLLNLCREGQPYRGDRVLAKRLHVHPSSVDRAIRKSDELKKWRATASTQNRMHQECELAPAPAAPSAVAPLPAVANDGHVSMTDAQIAAGFQSYKALNKFLVDHPEVPTSRPLSVRTGKPDPHRRMVDIAMLIKTKKAEDERTDYAKEELQEEVADRLALEHEAKRKAKASAAKHVPLGSRAT